jgi:hypothetical protein
LGQFRLKLLALSCVIALVGLLSSAADASTSKKSGSSQASKVKSVRSHKSSAKTKTTKSSSRRGKRSRKVSANWRKRGQQKIDSQRTTDIQSALIRENYLAGRPSGQWDAETQKAMERYQADHGWQSKVVPDSRALIKLGLGPDDEHLLNPQTAMTSQPTSQQPSPAAPATVVPASSNADRPQN